MHCPGLERKQQPLVHNLLVPRSEIVKLAPHRHWGSCLFVTIRAARSKVGVEAALPDHIFKVILICVYEGRDGGLGSQLPSDHFQVIGEVCQWLWPPNWIGIGNSGVVYGSGQLLFDLRHINFAKSKVLGFAPLCSKQTLKNPFVWSWSPLE